jgi:anti-sigma factor RsiW
MGCDEARTLLMGYLDRELGPEDRSRVRRHLDACSACRSEERAFRDLGLDLRAARPPGPSEGELAVLCRRVRSRLGRETGFLFLTIGSLALAACGAWQLLTELLVEGERSPALRMGVGAAGAGALVLAAGAVCDRFRPRRRGPPGDPE